MSHRNARLTVHGRRLLVERVGAGRPRDGHFPREDGVAGIQTKDRSPISRKPYPARRVLPLMSSRCGTTMSRGGTDAAGL
ncbi:leucine zipper domain-containing protein [Streptomyces misionensis]